MPQLDFAHFLPQLVWLAITFIVLYIVMSRVALPRIGAVLAARKEKVESDLEAADKARVDAEEALTAYDASMQSARDNAHAIVGKASEAASAEAAKRHAELDEHLSREATAAAETVAQAQEDAMANLRDIAADAARDATRKLIGVDASDEEVARAIDTARGG
ncbi:MAG: F0F1 ATP synthase subunit B' [Pseudomonadota bacterium]